MSRFPTPGSSRGSTAALAGVLCLALTVPALADESREEALERRIEQLEQRLEEVSTRQNAGDESELGARVAELEKLTKKDGDGLFWYWSKGMRASTANKRFKFKFGGRIMNDYTFWSSDRDTEAVVGSQLTSGTEFRRARLYVAGTIHEHVDFKAQYDFAGGDADFKDMYIALRTDHGKITVGHHYVPMGLETQTSSKYISTMERGLHDSLIHGRETGISVGDAIPDSGMHWRVGAFRDANDYGDDKGNMGESEWMVGGRVAGRPWIDDDRDDHFVHVGGSYLYERYSDEMVRYRARPMVHNGPRFADTGTIMAHHGETFGGELAYVMGPFHMQGEYVQVDVTESDPTVRSDPSFNGWTVEGGYFITGESRQYKGTSFSRTSPTSNWGDEDGCGAIEFVVAYSELDLDDGGVMGGKLDTWVLGLNWYLNPNTRVMLNYVMADLDRNNGLTGTSFVSADDVDAVQVRFQIDF